MIRWISASLTSWNRESPAPPPTLTRSQVQQGGYTRNPLQKFRGWEIRSFSLSIYRSSILDTATFSDPNSLRLPVEWDDHLQPPATPRADGLRNVLLVHAAVQLHRDSPPEWTQRAEGARLGPLVHENWQGEFLVLIRWVKFSSETERMAEENLFETIFDSRNPKPLIIFSDVKSGAETLSLEIM